MIYTRSLDLSMIAAFKDLRLRSLKEHPSAYGSSYEEWRQLTDEDWIRRSQNAHVTSFGAFWEGQLVGINALMRETLTKMKHRATIVAMYTLPEARGKGAGKALMYAALNHAKSLDGVEDVTLAVTVGNDSAKRLYENLGFVVYAREPRLFKINDQYFDVEQMILPLKEYKPE